MGAAPAVVAPGAKPGALPAGPPPLPALREDLALLPAAENRDGSPAWMIHDPVANRFYRIGWLEFEMLVRWQSSGAALLDAVRTETTLAPDDASLNGLLIFMREYCLLRADSAQASERLAAISARERRRDLRWVVHHYLFFRIPLVRPDRFLAATLPLVAFVFTRTFALTMVALTIAGLWLAGRQWDTFVASVHDNFTLEGVLAYLVALGAAKILHELGHAYTATRYGVRVAHMGVALVVLFPMLYTDTSESWKLVDHRQRFAIVAAGMLAEIGIAGLATLGWSLTQDGAVRDALFFLATTSWVLALAINASPFMRFDGYFLLSDYLDLPNLHPRSNAFGRAFLRRCLLGWRQPDPEALPRNLARFLTIFAFATWAYRFFLFLAIAVLVYVFFFKALGILLFLIEIIWFIALPIWSEVKVWWARRAETSHSRRFWGTVLLALLIGVLLVPLPHGINAPGWVRVNKSLALYSPFPARVVRIQAAGEVQAGTVLLELDSPDTHARGARTEAISQTLWLQLRRSGLFIEDAASLGPLRSLLEQTLAEGDGTREEVRRLVLSAPFAGTLFDLDPLVQPGVWVGPQQLLGVLIEPGAWIAEAFADEAALRYLRVGASAQVYLAESFAPLKATVIAIDSARTVVLPDPMLEATHGGPIHVSSVHERREVKQSVYRVRLRLDEPPVSQRTQLARIVIRGAPYALAADWLRGVTGVAIRESGF